MSSIKGHAIGNMDKHRCGYLIHDKPFVNFPEAFIIFPSVKFSIVILMHGSQLCYMQKDCFAKLILKFRI